ncbi:MAG TPA: PEP-CTERM sorting domain-containing protein [Bryobacteraceae bacterium]|jgi:hypothetical protein
MRRRFYIPAVLLAASFGVRADIIYNDPLTWLSAVGGPVATVNFEGLVAPGTFSFLGSGAGANTTLGGVNFSVGPSSNGDLFLIGDNLYFPGTAAISSQQSTTAFNDLRITLATSVAALGFYFGDFGGDTARITLSDGTIALPTAVMAPFLGFFGVTTSGAGINSVDISTPDPVMNVSAVLFGANSSTPEPAAPLLVGTVIVLAGFMFRKRSQRGF